MRRWRRLPKESDPRLRAPESPVLRSAVSPSDSSPPSDAVFFGTDFDPGFFGVAASCSGFAAAELTETSLPRPFLASLLARRASSLSVRLATAATLFRRVAGRVDRVDISSSLIAFCRKIGSERESKKKVCSGQLLFVYDR